MKIFRYSTNEFANQNFGGNSIGFAALFYEPEKVNPNCRINADFRHHRVEDKLKQPVHNWVFKIRRTAKR